MVVERIEQYGMELIVMMCDANDKTLVGIQILEGSVHSVKIGDVCD
jgi:hypothetical protein